MENLQRLLFWTFSSLMLASGAMAITRRHLVNAAMLLIQVILCMAGLFLLLDAPFLALVQILVYAGSVVVLFLFVVMLLGEDEATPRPSSTTILGAGVTFVTLCSLLLTVIVKQPPSIATGANVHNGLKDVVRSLFTQYVLPFELVALVLLTAMVGIVVLSRKR